MLTEADDLLLEDGRNLHFRVHGPSVSPGPPGPPGAEPVFYCHGIPGSSLEPSLPERSGGDGAPRVIALDRPGYGGSSPCPTYDFATHAADVLALARHLGVERFSLFGFSGGGVFAMACAAMLGARISRIVLASVPATELMADPLAGTGQLNRPLWRQARDQPDTLAESLTPLMRDGDTLVATMVGGLSQVDRDLLREPANAALYRGNLAHAVLQGPEQAATAVARDLALVMAPWGFDPAALAQPVRIFHGMDDGLLSHSHAQVLAAAIPRAQLQLDAACGHYGGIYGPGSTRLWRDIALG